MNAVVLLGPPGAGKGTLAEVLVERGYHHVSTGELLREQIRMETPLGLEAKALMDQGRFVPDDVVVGMIRDMVSSGTQGDRFLFDGFPRTLGQAEKLQELIGSIGGTLDSVILLECPDEILVERLSGRRTCSTCGAVYHMTFHPPKADEQCDVDGCNLVQRQDDNDEVIRKRLKVYGEQTAPLVDFYTAQNLLLSVDATQSIDAVRNAVLTRLG